MAAQSLLMLGMGEPWMCLSQEKPSFSGVPENQRFFITDSQQDQEVPNNPPCYYQKMREKNNAARYLICALLIKKYFKFFLMYALEFRYLS